MEKDSGPHGKWVTLATVKSLRILTYVLASKLAKEYEAKGGEYDNEAGSKNEPTKGTPKPKTSEKKDGELKGSAKASAKKETSTEKSDKENETPTTKKTTEKAPEKKEKAAPKVR